MKALKLYPLSVGLLLLLVWAAGSCDYANKVKDKFTKDETKFAITPQRITITGIGLSSELQVKVPDGHDASLLSWENKNGSIVAFKNGKVTALKTGEALLIATYNAPEATYRDSCKVRVMEGFSLAEGVSVKPGRKNLKQIGQTVQLRASVKPSTITQRVRWKSLHPRIASVSRDGLVTALSPGMAQIVATSYIDTTQADTSVVRLTVDDDYIFVVAPGIGQQPAFYSHLLRQTKEQVPGAGFYIAPGGNAPLAQSYQLVRKALGNQHAWYPTIEPAIIPQAEEDEVASENIKWLRNYFSVLPAITNPGPPKSPNTLYSFNYGEIHIIVINPYYNGESDVAHPPKISDALYNWIEEDLNKHAKQFTFVVAPVPPGGIAAEPQEALNEGQTQRLRRLLRKHKVMAYFTGGNTSGLKEFQGLWQAALNTQVKDRASFFAIRVQPDKAVFELYQGKNRGIFNKTATQAIYLRDYL